LLKCIPPSNITAWNRSLGELILNNGTRYKIFPACEPERLRGPQHHRAWCDELGSWQYPETWDMLQFGLRLGNDPRTVITTTPRPTKLIRDIIKDQKTLLTRGSTFDNAKNLAAPFLQTVLNKYQGTRLGRQELYAELLEDTPGALWTLKLLDETRVRNAPELRRIVVAVDPTVGSGDADCDECGVVVCGLGADGQGYVLEDCSLRDSPDGWAKAAVAAYHRWGADRIIAETNQGGEMVKLTLRTVDARIPFTAVRASRGKIARAEPVAALSEQKKIHLVGSFGPLENQLTTFVPATDAQSPDRLDAFVWGFTHLMLGRQFEREHVRP
jgi:phage terminase large subunit-like protein